MSARHEGALAALPPDSGALSRRHGRSLAALPDDPQVPSADRRHLAAVSPAHMSGRYARALAELYRQNLSAWHCWSLASLSTRRVSAGLRRALARLQAAALPARYHPAWASLHRITASAAGARMPARLVPHRRLARTAFQAAWPRRRDASDPQKPGLVRTAVAVTTTSAARIDRAAATIDRTTRRAATMRTRRTARTQRG